MPASTREPEARGPVSVFVLPSKISRSAYNYDLKTIKQITKHIGQFCPIFLNLPHCPPPSPRTPMTTSLVYIQCVRNDFVLFFLQEDKIQQQSTNGSHP